MSFYAYSKKLLVLSVLTLVVSVANGQDVSTDAGKLLPPSLGDFRAAARPSGPDAPMVSPQLTSSASRAYVAKDNARFVVDLYLAKSDGAAFSILAQRRVELGGLLGITFANVGTDGFVYRDEDMNNLMFFKGRAVVSIRDEGKSQNADALRDFANGLAETLDKGEAEIPSIVKHMPGWPGVQERTLYLLTQYEVQQTFSDQSALEALNFATGTEAAVANYDGSRLLLLEFKTPQLASDNDGRIVTRVQELRNSGQPTPSAYRRVGNYLVFVFDATNEQSANGLIDQIQYQQVVQWLGRNPTLYDKAVNDFSRTTLGVFIAVVKASGLVIIGSLAIGGLLGTLLFRVRRKQQRMAQAYSDAGGMLRLNIDELNATHDPARLLGPRT